MINSHQFVAIRERAWFKLVAKLCVGAGSAFGATAADGIGITLGACPPLWPPGGDQASSPAISRSAPLGLDHGSECSFVRSCSLETWTSGANEVPLEISATSGACPHPSGLLAVSRSAPLGPSAWIMEVSTALLDLGAWRLGLTGRMKYH